MCGKYFYRSLPYLNALICFLEITCIVALIATIVSEWSSESRNSDSTTTTPSITTTDVVIQTTTDVTTATYIITTTSASPSFFDEIPTPFIIAFSITLVGSIVPIFTGAVLLLSIPCCCWCLINPSCRQPYLRFISLNCKCPCYSPRPKLRFIIRICFHLFCILLRVIATMMYGILYMQASDDDELRIMRLFLLVTGVSLIFPFIIVLLDVYHYRVWWAYKPDIGDDLPPETIKKSFSHKHRRFIPYVLTEAYRTQSLGNRSCADGNRCKNRELEHIAIFHSTKHQPQSRYTKEHKRYIGFHQTRPSTSFQIVKSTFLPSKQGMLGPGAYFARSIEGTERKVGKDGGRGAMFIVEIEMGKVYEVNFAEIRDKSNPAFNQAKYDFVTNGDWHQTYDTCYFKHYEEGLDEFCIKDPEKQIRSWVVVVHGQHDQKMREYRLVSEMGSEMCGCI